MCARYSLMSSPQEFLDLFKVVEEPFEPRAEIFPTNSVPVILSSENGTRRAQEMNWGIRPSWNTTSNQVLINVRSETATKRPTFRHSFEKRRCLMPASCFYEWQGPRRFSFRRPDKNLFAFAAIYEENTCALMTAASQNPINLVHDRMPVLLAPEMFDLWLAPQTPILDLERLCINLPMSLEIQEVDRRRPEIEIFGPGPTQIPSQPDLF